MEYLKEALEADAGLPHADDGALMRFLVATDDTAAFKLVADAIRSGPVPAQMPADASGRSLLRLAAERSPPNRAIVEEIFSLIAAALADPVRGYDYAVFFESAPTLLDDLVFIFKYADPVIEPALCLLEDSGFVAAPEDFQLGNLKIDPKGAEMRPFAGGTAPSPFDLKAAGTKDKNPQISTEVVAISILGLSRPAKDPIDMATSLLSNGEKDERMIKDTVRNRPGRLSGLSVSLQ